MRKLNLRRILKRTPRFLVAARKSEVIEKSK